MRAILLKERLLTDEVFIHKIIAWFLFFLFLYFLAGKYYAIIQQEVYPVVHTVIEYVIVLVAICASMMSWYDYKYKHELKMLIISLTFGIVAPFEFAHALSYMGMPDFITPNSVNKASTFFIITKLFLAVGLFTAVFMGEKIKILRRSALIPAFSFLVSAVLIVLVANYLSYLPAMYDPVASSQTGLKSFLGYMVIAIEVMTAIRLLMKKGIGKQDVYLGMSLVIIIMSDLSFTRYYSPYDTYNLLGHIYQIFSFVFIFKTIIDEAIGVIYENNRALERQWELLAEKNRQLQEADQLKDEFLANTNHELRTPLAAIIAFTEMLLDESTGKLNELQKDYLNEISDSSKELLERINGFLDLSKIAAGKTVLYKEEFEVDELIEDIAGKMKHLFNQKGITIEMPPEASLLKVWADREKVGQVLTSLLSNALKFTVPSGRVAVEAGPAEAGQGVYISITDSGIGIDTSDQEKIFQPFQQLDGTSARKYSGTGIGLTLTRKLVDLHGGSIWVSSEINKGSTFTFTLPAREK
ncbi:MAG: MASE3 domain-containing protein [Desulfotomaculaceae bacterium]